ncbi:UNVERIFIED_CONTAM: hypothetical protein GTU68_027302, partial [Idotea baltica]|nr:hypothetical protein [Idotea baltica]
MQFASDNEGPVHPKVMAALTAANEGYSPSYGADDAAALVQNSIREIFDAPQAAVYQVATGTAANALILATMAQPWQTVFCGTRAHIHEDECGAPEFYSGGSKLTLVPETEGRMTADALRAVILGEENRGVHGPQRGPVSITQATESGSIYSLEQLNALTAVAQEFNLPVQMDGARFANALVRLGCTPAEMT